MKRALTVIVLALTALSASPQSVAAELHPLVAGWEQHFRVDWQPGKYRAKPVVEGYVNNLSPYHTRMIRVLVDSLDANGQITAQKIAWVPGDLGGGSRLFFQVPTAPAPAYRVRVFSYDRVELDSNFR